jgi:PE-PPE domain
MRRAGRRRCLGAAVAIAGTSLIAAPVAPSAPHIGVRDVQLTSGDAADSPLGDGTALVMGGSGIPIPPQSYVDAADKLYLQPRDFTGTPQALDTPEGFYPTTGVNSLTADASEAQGAQILDGAVTGQIAVGRGFRLLPELRFVHIHDGATPSPRRAE